MRWRWMATFPFCWLRSLCFFVCVRLPFDVCTRLVRHWKIAMNEFDWKLARYNCDIIKISVSFVQNQLVTTLVVELNVFSILLVQPNQLYILVYGLFTTIDWIIRIVWMVHYSIILLLIDLVKSSHFFFTVCFSDFLLLQLWKQVSEIVKFDGNFELNFQFCLKLIRSVWRQNWWFRPFPVFFYTVFIINFIVVHCKLIN